MVGEMRPVAVAHTGDVKRAAETAGVSSGRREPGAY
jgi:hypothetical protein